MPTVLITGANRGIGLEFTKIYAARGWDVIAAVRDPASFPAVDGSIRVVKIDAASTTDAADVAKDLKADGVKLDVVIANAGILSKEGMVDFAKVDIGVFDQHWQINVRGVLVLFQAMRPLMVSGGKFIALGSGSGTIKQDHPPGQGTYGLTKAAINFLMRKIHFEEPDILAAALHPGWIATEMGNDSAWHRGLQAPPDDIKDTVPGMVELIDEGDKDKIGGWTTRWNGERMEY